MEGTTRPWVRAELSVTPPEPPAVDGFWGLDAEADQA